MSRGDRFFQGILRLIGTAAAAFFMTIGVQVMLDPTPPLAFSGWGFFYMFMSLTFLRFFNVFDNFEEGDFLTVSDDEDPSDLPMPVEDTDGNMEWGPPVILCNALECRKCGDYIVSKGVHDFQKCSCGAIGVDGGRDYLRRIGNPEDWRDFSVMAQFPIEKEKR